MRVLECGVLTALALVYAVLQASTLRRHLTRSLAVLPHLHIVQLHEARLCYHPDERHSNKICAVREQDLVIEDTTHSGQPERALNGKVRWCDGGKMQRNAMVEMANAK